jgi:hypothetical protein
MITVRHLRAFSSELSKIAQVKCANTSALLPPQQQAPMPAPSISGGSTAVKVKAPKKGGILAKSTPTYSKVNSDPAPSPIAGKQSFSNAPVAKS